MSSALSFLRLRGKGYHKMMIMTKESRIMIKQDDDVSDKKTSHETKRKGGDEEEEEEEEVFILEEQYLWPFLIANRLSVSSHSP